MNWLALDTSTSRASVALFAHDVIYTITEPHLREHARLLLPMIDGLLSEANITCRALSGIVFGCGPGGSTGVRIACSVVQGLGVATAVPLYPVSGLQVIAADLFRLQTESTEAVGVLVLLDARMQEVYWAYFDKPGAPLICHVSPMSQVVVPGNKPLILGGVGFLPMMSSLSASIVNRVIHQAEHFPEASSMIRLAQSGVLQAVSPADAQPTYVRDQVTQGNPHG